MKILGIAIVVPFIVCFCPFVSPQKWHSAFERGFSDQYRSESTLGEYAFGYNEDHSSGGSFRRETSDRQGNKIGSYGLRIADGRLRVVNYVADQNGYRANVISNEPGMSSQISNGYLAITMKSMQGALIPGFSYSSDPPHVTFDGDDIDEGKEQSIDEQNTDMIVPLPTGHQMSAYSIANEVSDVSPYSVSSPVSNKSSQLSMSTEMKLGSVGDGMNHENDPQTIHEVIKATADETAQMKNEIKASHDSSKFLQETKN